jgi:hypothetical protein
VVSPRGNRWYQAYFKPLLRLCEFYQDNPDASKKLIFSDIVQETLKYKNSSLDANTRKAMLALTQKIANKRSDNLPKWDVKILPQAG